jgi:hypothetical protein
MLSTETGWQNLSGVIFRYTKTKYTSGLGKGKRKAIPLQALAGPEGSRGFRLTDFKTIGT